MKNYIKNKTKNQSMRSNSTLALIKIIIYIKIQTLQILMVLFDFNKHDKVHLIAKKSNSCNRFLNNNKKLLRTQMKDAELIYKTKENRNKIYN